jgi:hypothetical protein
MLAMNAKRPYSDVCCLLDDPFDSLGVLEDDTYDAKLGRAQHIFCAWSLIDRLTLEDVRRIHSIRLPRSVHTESEVTTANDGTKYRSSVIATAKVTNAADVLERPFRA